MKYAMTVGWEVLAGYYQVCLTERKEAEMTGDATAKLKEDRELRGRLGEHLEVSSGRNRQMRGLWMPSRRGRQSTPVSPGM